MAVFAGLTPQEFNNYAQIALQRHRDALVAIKEVSDGIAGESVQDWVTAGMPQTQAQTLYNAITDGMGEYNIHYTGSDPRNVGAGYIYAASQEQVIGPLIS